MAEKKFLFDEIDFNDPRYLTELPEQDVDKANNFSWYFYSSPWNEPEANNTAILNAHQNDPAGREIIYDRKEFHQRLVGMPYGLQFVVAGEPQGPGQPWLMQRQNRIDGGDTYVEGNWYNQGTALRQAPSLLDVVRSRMVSD